VSARLQCRLGDHFAAHKYGTHLHSDLDGAKKLQLVLRDELSERDQKPDLQSRETMIWQAKPDRCRQRDPVTVSTGHRLHIGQPDSQSLLGTRDHPNEPAEAKRDHVGADNDDGAKSQELVETPHALKVTTCEREGDCREYELVRASVDTFSILQMGAAETGPKPTSNKLSSTQPAVNSVQGYIQLFPGTSTNQGMSMPVKPGSDRFC
jgi:hypothetical protein